jgi:hypothetical protein
MRIEAPVDGHDGHWRTGTGVWEHPSDGNHDILVPDRLNEKLILVICRYWGQETHRRVE